MRLGVQIKQFFAVFSFCMASMNSLEAMFTTAGRLAGREAASFVGARGAGQPDAQGAALLRMPASSFVQLSRLRRNNPSLFGTQEQAQQRAESLFERFTLPEAPDLTSEVRTQLQQAQTETYAPQPQPTVPSALPTPMPPQVQLPFAQTGVFQEPVELGVQRVLEAPSETPEELIGRANQVFRLRAELEELERERASATIGARDAIAKLLRQETSDMKLVRLTRELYELEQDPLVLQKVQEREAYLEQLPAQLEQEWRDNTRQALLERYNELKDTPADVRNDILNEALQSAKDAFQERLLAYREQDPITKYPGMQAGEKVDTTTLADLAPEVLEQAAQQQVQPSVAPAAVRQSASVRLTPSLSPSMPSVPRRTFATQAAPAARDVQSRAASSVPTQAPQAQPAPKAPQALQSPSTAVVPSRQFISRERPGALIRGIPVPIRNVIQRREAQRLAAQGIPAGQARKEPRAIDYAAINRSIVDFMARGQRPEFIPEVVSAVQAQTALVPFQQPTAPQPVAVPASSAQPIQVLSRLPVSAPFLQQIQAGQVRPALVAAYTPDSSGSAGNLLIASPDEQIALDLNAPVQSPRMREFVQRLIQNRQAYAWAVYPQAQQIATQAPSASTALQVAQPQPALIDQLNAALRDDATVLLEMQPSQSSTALVPVGQSQALSVQQMPNYADVVNQFAQFMQNQQTSALPQPAVDTQAPVLYQPSAQQPSQSVIAAPAIPASTQVVRVLSAAPVSDQFLEQAQTGQIMPDLLAVYAPDASGAAGNLSIASPEQTLTFDLSVPGQQFSPRMQEFINRLIEHPQAYAWAFYPGQVQQAPRVAQRALAYTPPAESPAPVMDRLNNLLVNESTVIFQMQQPQAVAAPALTYAQAPQAPLQIAQQPMYQDIFNQFATPAPEQRVLMNENMRITYVPQEQPPVQRLQDSDQLPELPQIETAPPVGPVQSSMPRLPQPPVVVQPPAMPTVATAPVGPAVPPIRSSLGLGAPQPAVGRPISPPRIRVPSLPAPQTRLVEGAQVPQSGPSAPADLPQRGQGLPDQINQGQSDSTQPASSGIPRCPRGQGLPAEARATPRSRHRSAILDALSRNLPIQQHIIEDFRLHSLSIMGLLNLYNRHLRHCYAVEGLDWHNKTDSNQVLENIKESIRRKL